MVRPSERYRHGARRRGGPQLEPVYLVGSSGSGFTAQTMPTTTSFAVHTGSQGKVAEFVPWDLSPLALATTAEPGLIASISQTLEDTYSEVTINSSSWAPVQTNRINLIYDQLLDGVLYCCFSRVSKVIGAVSVNYTITSGLGSPISGSKTESNVHSALSCDMITVAVDLSTGAISHATAPLYQNVLTVYGWVSSAFYRWRHAGSFEGFKEAVTASMPETHPFRSCGEQAWSFLPSTDASLNLLYGLGLSQVGSLNFDTNQLNDGYDLLILMPQPFHFSTTAFSTAISIRLKTLRGLNSLKRQRVFSYWTGYYEWSTLDGNWLTCEGFTLLGESVETTYSEYDPNGLRNRKDLLVVSGLDAEDRISQLEDPTTTPAESLGSGSNTEYTTSRPRYFREAPTRPTFAEGATQYLRNHYWINS